MIDAQREAKVRELRLVIAAIVQIVASLRGGEMLCVELEVCLDLLGMYRSAMTKVRVGRNDAWRYSISIERDGHHFDAFGECPHQQDAMCTALDGLREKAEREVLCHQARLQHSAAPAATERV